MESFDNFNKEIDDLRNLKLNIHELRKIYDNIENEIIREPLKKIIITSDKIYKEVVQNTWKLYKIRNFNNYYIITVQKVLRQYIKLNTNKINTDEVKKLCIKIENFIINVNESFKKIYNSLFEDEVIDIDSEIKVMLNEIKLEE